MKDKYLGYAYLINTILFFSTYEVVSKTLAGRIDSFQINFIRFLVGGLVLFSVLLFKGDVSVRREYIPKVILAGVINVVISMNLIQLSLFAHGAKAAVTAVLFSCNPIFVSLFASFLDNEKISIQKIAGALLGLLGTIVIFLEDLDFGMTSIWSPAFAVMAAAFFGLYTVMGKKISTQIGSLKMNAYSFISGSLILLVILAVSGKPVFVFDYSVTGRVAYLSVMVTGIAYLTYFKGLSIVGAGKGSLVFFLKPAIASIFAVIFLGEAITLNLAAGTALILLGIYTALFWDYKSLKSFLIRQKENRKISDS